MALPAPTHTENRHTPAHYRVLPTGQVVFVHDYDSNRRIAAETQPALLHQRTGKVRRPGPAGTPHENGFSLRATNAQDFRTLRGHAAAMGIPFRVRRAGANHFGRVGAYDHLDFNTSADAARVLDAVQHQEEHGGAHPPVQALVNPRADTGADTAQEFQRIHGATPALPPPDKAEIESAFTNIFGDLPEIEPETYTVTAADIDRIKAACNCSQVDFSNSSIDAWNSLVKLNPSAMLGDIYKPFGPGGKLTIGCDSSGNMTIRYTNVRIEISRAYSLTRKSVDHSYFTSGDTGEDKGKQLFAASIPFYQKLGLKKITVHANISVGSYCWARYGFVPIDATNLQTIKGFFRGAPKYATWTRDPAFAAAMDSTDPKTVWALAAFLSKEIKEGRLHRDQNPMLHHHWHGHIKLDDPNQMAVVMNYCTRGGAGPVAPRRAR